MQIKEALDKLFSLHKFGVKLGLENIENFLAVLGNPQDSLKTFHIAGTNGKGSTSSFIASILTEAGYKTGLYTSPHFVKFNERVKIANKQIDDEFITDFFTEHYDYIMANGLTFFEVTTAIAFQYFKINNVDYAVIETGLGGRLDATNVLKPMASVITSISLEHTSILGNTYAEIAAEKAGIIKPGKNVFIGRLNDEARETIKQKCALQNANLYEIKNYVNGIDDKLSFKNNKVIVDSLVSPLRGEYQRYNAALAVLAVTETLEINEAAVIKKGLENVSINTGLECRFENYSDKPRVIFESAHNPEGITVFIKEFIKDSSLYKKRTLLFGVMRDKSVEEMLKMLAPCFDQIVFTSIQYDRCATIEELQSMAQKVEIKAAEASEPDLFIKEFIKNADSEECLVVLGSMYVLGEIKTRFSK